MVGPAMLLGDDERDDGSTEGAPLGFQWIWADPHVHTGGCNQDSQPELDPILSPLEILDAMEARGLDVGDVLVWGPTGGVTGTPNMLKEWDQLTGTDYNSAGEPCSSCPGGNHGNKVLHYDLEVSFWLASQMGHITALGLDDIHSKWFGPCGWGSSHDPNFPWRPIAGSAFCPWELWGDAVGEPPGPPEQHRHETGLEIVWWAWNNGVSNGGVLGVNHTTSWSLDHNWLPPGLVAAELPVHVINGTMNYPPISFMAVETAQLDTIPGWHPESDPNADVLTRAARQLWNDLQNSGLRIAIMGASDNRCFQRQVGQLRTGVLVSASGWDFESYVAAIKAGRTQAAYDRGSWGNLDAWAGTPFPDPADVAHIGDQLDVTPGQLVYFGAWAKTKKVGNIEVLINGETVPGCQWVSQAPDTPYYFACVFVAGEAGGVLEHSAWVSLRAPRVQTSPIYVRVGLPPDFMEPIAPSVEAPCRMVRHVDGLINHLNNNPLGHPPALCRDGSPCAVAGCLDCCPPVPPSQNNTPCQPSVLDRYIQARDAYIQRAHTATFYDDDPGNDGQPDVCFAGGGVGLPLLPIQLSDPRCPQVNDELVAWGGDWYDYHWGNFLNGQSGSVTGTLTQIGGAHV